MSTAPAVTPAPPTDRTKVIPWFFAALIVPHLLAPLAFLPYCFSWWGLGSLLVTSFLFGTLGINLSYHRLLTHRSVEMPKWLERTFVLFGVCCLEGSPLWWVLNHRIHHQKSDEDGDPHSPKDHFFWGHMRWIYTPDPQRDRLSTYEKYVPDLMADPFLRWLHRGHKWAMVWALHVVLIAAAGFGAGFLLMDTVDDAVQVGVKVFMWGVIVRTVYVWHVTWSVNSAAHRWGYRNYETPDRSTNNWVVALVSNGEGWHNNHHAAPRVCTMGHKWWEVDLTFTFVRLLQVVGLAWDVVPVKVADYRKKEATEEV